jgi:hypothetical protein
MRPTHFAQSISGLCLIALVISHFSLITLSNRLERSALMRQQIVDFIRGTQPQTALAAVLGKSLCLETEDHLFQVVFQENGFFQYKMDNSATTGEYILNSAGIRGFLGKKIMTFKVLSLSNENVLLAERGKVGIFKESNCPRPLLSSSLN